MLNHILLTILSFSASSIFGELISNPIYLLALFGVLLLFVGLVPQLKEWVSTIGLLGLLASWAVTVLHWDMHGGIVKFNMISLDQASMVTAATCIAITILIFLMTDHKEYDNKLHMAEFYSLMIFGLIGVIIMASFRNLLMLFIGIEILSISLYILAGFNKKNLLSNEASLKYFLLGAFVTGILLMGITLVYGTSGSLDIMDIREYQKGLIKNIPALHYLGILLLLSAMAFKVSAAPFHFWAPDVYHGSPTPVTAFMSTVVKIASITAFYRLFYNAFYFTEMLWINTFVGIILLTLAFGNLIAAKQSNFKRLLAYSSVANVAFMLMPFLYLMQLNAENRVLSFSNIWFYMVAYSAASIITLLAVQLVENHKGSSDIAAFNGLYKRNPLLGVCILIGLCSLAGIPITAGFFGKYYMLTAIIENGYLWVAIIALLFSVVGIFYYFKVVRAMFIEEADAEIIHLNPPHIFVLLICSALIIVLGFAPMLIHNLL